MKEIYGGKLEEFPGAKLAAALLKGIVVLMEGHPVSAHQSDNNDGCSTPPHALPCSFWDAKEKAWRECWDDPEVKGAFMNFQAPSIASAKLWVGQQMNKHFPTKTHTVRNSYCGLEEREERLWKGKR